MVDNPDEYYAHYYRYYRRRTAPNVDVRLILAVMITLISGIQYYSSWEKYESAIKYLATIPKYRLKAVEIAQGCNCQVLLNLVQHFFKSFVKALDSLFLS